MEGKTKKNDTIHRFDVIDGPNWMIEPFTRTREGYLTGRAVITNVGVFEYMNVDGTTRRELRLPEEVFASETVESFKMKPITNDHPSQAVMAENIKDLQVGATGSAPSADGTWNGQPFGNGEGVGDYPNGKMPDTDRYHFSIDMTITDERAVEDVLEGKRALSAGYTVEIEEKSGVWMGIQYDAVQRNIRGNHVAIVDRGRAGDAARIILREDSADALCVGRCEIQQTKQEDSMEFKKIHLDGVEYQAEAKVLETLDKQNKRVDELEKGTKSLNDDLSKANADRDNLKAKVDSLEKDLADEKAKNIDEASIKKAAKEYLEVADAAKLAKVDVKDEMSVEDIKADVVMSVYASDDEQVKLDLLEKLKADSVYLNGRFDGAVELLKRETKQHKTNTEKTQTKIDENTFVEDSEKAQKSYVTSVQDAWKRDGDE